MMSVADLSADQREHKDLGTLGGIGSVSVVADMKSFKVVVSHM
jgi:hypothetical protein